MFIYREEERFDSTTGKPVGKTKVYAECLCDVCGESIDNPDFRVKVDYGGMDACFGSDGEEHRFGKEYDVDMKSFLSAPFTSHNTWCDESGRCCDSVLGEEVVRSGLADAIRILKVQTARRLIESGKIKPNDLNDK